MATLNTIAEDIAYKLGDQFNNTLKESIKHTITFYRAKLIRDEVDRNGITTTSYYQPILIEFEKVNIFEDLGANLSCLAPLCDDATKDEKYYVLKSKKKIPKTMNLKAGSISNFKFFGSIDRRVAFRYGEPQSIPYLIDQPYQKSKVFYFMVNDFVYLLNTEEVCEALADAIFDDPRQAFDLCKSDVFIDDNEYPISQHLLYFITKGIVNGDYPLQNKADGEEINLKSDKAEQ
jgi:hypothetical protein